MTIEAGNTIKVKNLKTGEEFRAIYVGKNFIVKLDGKLVVEDDPSILTSEGFKILTDNLKVMGISKLNEDERGLRELYENLESKQSYLAKEVISLKYGAMATVDVLKSKKFVDVLNKIYISTNNTIENSGINYRVYAVEDGKIEATFDLSKDDNYGKITIPLKELYKELATNTHGSTIKNDIEQVIINKCKGFDAKATSERYIHVVFEDDSKQEFAIGYGLLEDCLLPKLLKWQGSTTIINELYLPDELECRFLVDGDSKGYNDVVKISNNLNANFVNRNIVEDDFKVWLNRLVKLNSDVFLPTNKIKEKLAKEYIVPETEYGEMLYSLLENYKNVEVPQKEGFFKKLFS